MALARTLRVPHVHLDELYWGPGWKPRPPAQFLADVAAATAGDAWIVDGNYRSTREIVWPRATAIVWLDYPFATVFGRTLGRTLQRVATRRRLFAGNRESLRRAFLSRESILWWVITQHRRYRRDFRALMSTAAGPARWIAIRGTRDADAMLQALGAAHA
jgi:adenylate kinase family enzyme